MAGPATILRELHRLLRHARELQAQIERSPQSLKAQQARVSRQEVVLREAQEALKRQKVTSHEKEVQLKATLQQITKHEDQLNQATSKKEYDALKSEISAGKRKCQELEDAILDCLGLIEEKTAQLPELDKTIQRAKEEFADFERNAQRRQVDLAAQLDQTHRTIKEVENTLPGDVRPLYDRLIAARGEDALAAVQNRTCMACYTEITAQAHNDLMLSQSVLCKSCGRVLYLPE